jgi:hypothetical protein
MIISRSEKSKRYFDTITVDEIHCRNNPESLNKKVNRWWVGGSQSLLL